MPDCDEDAEEDDEACVEPPEFCTCASCASSDLISALSLSMAAVVASLDDDEPPPPPPPPPPDFFALEVEVEVEPVAPVDELDDVLLEDVVLLSVLLLAVEAAFDAFVAVVPPLPLVVPV